MLPFYIIVLLAIGLPIILLIALIYFCDGDDGPYTTYGPDMHSIFDKDGPF